MLLLLLHIVKLHLSSSTLDVSSRIPLSLSTTVRQFRVADANSAQLQRFVTSKVKADARVRTQRRTDGMGLHMQAILHIGFSLFGLSLWCLWFVLL